MASPEGFIQSLLRAPTLASEDDTRRARLLYRLLGTMAGLAVLGTVSALFETRNDWRVTAFFYGIVGVWLVGMAVLVRRGKVVLAAWVLSVLFWLMMNGPGRASLDRVLAGWLGIGGHRRPA